MQTKIKKIKGCNDCPACFSYYGECHCLFLTPKTEQKTVVDFAIIEFKNCPLKTSDITLSLDNRFSGR